MKINRRPSAARWIKPNPREVKLNVDASFTHDLHAGALGAVLRDFKGNFLAGRMVYLPHVGSSQMAEALAMKEGLALANEIGVSNLIAESDSLETVEACSGINNGTMSLLLFLLIAWIWWLQLVMCHLLNALGKQIWWHII
jgi:hypothetical protein